MILPSNAMIRARRQPSHSGLGLEAGVSINVDQKTPQIMAKHENMICTTTRITRTWQEVLEQIALEGSLLGLLPEAIAESGSLIARFVAARGHLIADPIDAPTMELIRGLIDEPRNILSIAEDLAVDASQLENALRSLYRNYVALAETHFGQLLCNSIKLAGLSKEKFLVEIGQTREKWRFWVNHPYGGVTGMTAELALQIESRLQTGGKVFAAYCALRRR
jgi:hypothetical protein